jgi:rsbT co-antagonist protein RsbR
MSEQANVKGGVDIERLERRVAELEEALQASEEREKALRAKSTRSQRMLDEIDQGGWGWDIVTGEAYGSRGWFRLLGYDEEKVAPTFESWSRMIYPEDLPRVIAALQDHVEGRAPAYDVEFRMLHASGKLQWMRSRGRVVERDSDGRALHMAGTLTDITKRKEAEEDLRNSQALLRALSENSPSMIYVRDLDYRYMFMTKKHGLMFGFEESQILGKTDEDLFPPSVVETFRVTDRAVLATGKPVTSEEPVNDGGRTRIFHQIKFPLFDEHGRIVGLGGIASDITEVKQAEAERAELQERIITAQRVALRELSTPLIPIADDVVVMPLIGTIDSQRAQQLMDTLLEGVAAHRARTVILDVTGVAVVDTHVANAIVRASRAVKLLGAEAVLTGIRPEVARTLAAMGAELEGIVVRGTLRSGIGYAMRLQ